MENVGPGPAHGNLVLEATLTAPQAISSPQSSAGAQCVPLATSQNFASAVAVPVTATASCTDTFPPGATTPIPLHVQVTGGASSGQSLTVTAVVNPDHTIVEGNYANDSFSRTFVVS